MIVVSAHIGCIEELIASVAGRGWPVYGVADDSAYPELYELLERQRARWGVREIAWRNLREVFRVLREPFDPRPARRLGVPAGGCARPVVRRLDDAPVPARLSWPDGREPQSSRW